MKRKTNKKPKGSGDASSQPTFRDLSLSEETIAALDKAGYENPTPIQNGAIPVALSGKDLMGQARTGTGKTAAFVIPVLEMLGATEKGRHPQALVLVPTRELAVQVRDEATKLSSTRKARSVAIYGGKPIRRQIQQLSRGAELVIGTPGRLLDHLNRGTLELAQLRWVVLDEADRMLDIGFRPDIEKILKRCPRDRQTLLFSATIAPPIERLAKRYMRDPEKLDFSPGDLSVATIEQHYFTVDQHRKFGLLQRLIQREDPTQAIIFCRTKRGTDKVCHGLSKVRKSVSAIHGDMQQNARDRVMAQFRGGDLQVLVATDIVGRGIDVSGISHIINYDIPHFADDYIHRVGRTGRMGREGVAFTFVTPEEGGELTRIEMRINRILLRDEIKDYEAYERKPDESEATSDAEPEKQEKKTAAPLGRRGRSPRRNRRAL